MEIAKKKYYLNPNEFAVLVANVGVKTLYGIHSLKAVDSKEMCKVMHSLYTNQIIDNPEGKSFSVQQEMKEILYDIRDSRYMVTLESEQLALAICCYLGGNVIMVYESQGKLAIVSKTRDEFIEDTKSFVSEAEIKIYVRQSATGEELKALSLKEEGCEKQLKQIFEEYCREV